ncbi:CSEP0278 putative effector protein [Blumeria hordei DH14]|uniref:CSEP0278 putative effector protein n=1 Tax=Blumeria graminis f. sp. hordei (strain DH14) TaxID=546991 RepID=N1J4N8_BLUG1|nr:CSEP0278 putative effector protein [Blumeria hordei DH14]
MFLISTLFTILLLWGCVFAEQWRQVWVLGKYEGTIEGSKKFSVCHLNNSIKTEANRKIGRRINDMANQLCHFRSWLYFSSKSYVNRKFGSYNSFNAACRLDKAAPSGDCVLTLQSGSSSSTRSTRVGSEVLTRTTMLVVAGPGETSTIDTSTTYTSTTISSTADSSTTTSCSSTADVSTSSSSTVINPSSDKKLPSFSQGSTIIFSPNRTGIAITGSVFDSRPVRTSSKDFPSPTTISKGDTIQNSISTVGALIIFLSILIQ